MAYTPLVILARAHGSTVHARRVRVIVSHLASLLPADARVLDVGCGDGQLSALLAERRPDLSIEGVDVLVRPDARIPVRAFDGSRLPFEDRSFDAVMAIDVLHHADDPTALLSELARVARDCLVIKDHRRQGLGAESTLRLMDWVGNRAHGVSLPYHYLSPEQWRDAFERLGLRVDDERRELRLYPRPASWLFDRDLHFIARLRSDAAPPCAPASEWERAYLVFETPDEARRKIHQRLVRLGAREWPPQSRVLEIFCGAGSGLDALYGVGLSSVQGMDLSSELVGRYRGPARCSVGDCRDLPYETGSQDVVVVQGGLHHLESRADVERVLREVDRVLAPGGRFCAVEPWRTPFLDAVRYASRQPLLRRVWPKLDAFQTMVENELVTYERWLNDPEAIERALRAMFDVRLFELRRGSLMFVGEKRA